MARRSAAGPGAVPAMAGGPMPWVIAVVTALALLGVALALVLAPAASALDGQVAGRASIQVVEGDAIRRREAVASLRTMLEDAPYVSRAQAVPEAELRRMAERWLGDGVGDLQLPLPALIDVDFVGGAGDPPLQRLRADVRRIAPQAEVVSHAEWLAPVARLFRSLGWIAILLALALLAAVAAIAVIAARASLASQRTTIDILHLVGATDVQVARQFQRQIARDVAGGVAMGTLAALVIGTAVALQMRDVTAGLAQGGNWCPFAVLLLLPPVIIALAVMTTRWTVLATLRRTL